MSRLAEFRRDLDRRFPGQYTQEAVAKRLGIAVRSYAGYELGTNEPPVTIAVAIARDLGITVEQLQFKRTNRGGDPTAPQSST